SQVEGWGGEEHARHLQWGLGWAIQNGERSNAIWHWGDNGTFRCFVIAYPSQGRGLVYFTNSQNGLSIADDLVSRFFEDSHHAIRWLDYPAWDDPRQRSRIALRRSFLESREAGMARLGELRESGPETVDGDELGDLAEYLADRDRFASAVAVAEARLAWEAVPEAALGLAEVLTAADRHAEALEAYERALAMDPTRREEVEPRLAWLRSGLEARRAPVRLEEEELRRYAGDYGPRHVRLEDGRLIYAREGSTESTPLVPLTRELFAVAASGDFRLRFVLDGSGRPVSLIGSYADGSEDETPRDP
ncbi:MAG: hypothetical protein R3266_15405, partial [Gemmatimonadota bacterium]|nr:hypothetical protein [Gemmatimonadota bacterium]